MKPRYILAIGGLALMLGACSGGDRPDFDDGAAEPNPVATATVSGDDTDDTAADADAELSEGGEDPAADDDPATDDSTDDEVEPVDEPDDADDTVDPEDTVVAGPDPADYASQGTALVALADGRSYEGSVACETSTSGGDWVFRFGGVTDAGVQLEGAYDTSQPDFAIVFVAGPDSLSGDGVLLSMINGGDDLTETNNSGNEWIAAITLWTPEGDPIAAQVTAACG